MTKIERLELAARHLRDAARLLDVPNYIPQSDDALQIANVLDCEIRHLRDPKAARLQAAETAAENYDRSRDHE